MFAVRVRWNNVAPVVFRRVRGMAPVARVKPGTASRPSLGGSYTMIIFFLENDGGTKFLLLCF